MFRKKPIPETVLFPHWVHSTTPPPLAPEPDRADALIRDVTGGRIQKEAYPNHARVELTVSCHDCDAIPKVPNAGDVIEENGVRVQVMHNGLRIAEGSYLGSWTTEIIRRLKGHHEPQEELLFSEVLRHVAPGGVMAELGANWAWYSLWFHHAVPDAVNWMLEPNPHNLEAGKRNFALNGFTGHFLQAVSGQRSAAGKRFYCAEDGRVIHVRQLSVDDLLDSEGIARLDLLHADIQGAEYETLLGAERSVAAGRLRFVFLSTHHYAISGDPQAHQRCIAFLKAHGASILAEHSVSESFSGDGLIVASFDPADRAIALPPISRNLPRFSLWPEPEYDLAIAARRVGPFTRLRVRLGL